MTVGPPLANTLTSVRESAAAPAPRRFRADIQALRALAVALVVVYHLRPGWAPGGFIGVDIFFVISGFLITSHLVRDAQHNGRIRLGAFWAARARRILPAALVTIAVTIVVTVASSAIADRTELRPQALASIFYVQNWQLARESVDYLASDNLATPFQHFWSLAVEEQFYLFWPLLVSLALVLSAWAVRRRQASSPVATARRAPLTGWLLGLFGAIVLASLIASIIEVRSGHADAYFATTTRVWELGAGGLLATVVLRPQPRWLRLSLIYSGLATIVASTIWLSSDSPFPGVAALPVIAGTVAMIAGGTPGRPRCSRVRAADAATDVPEVEVSLGRHDPWSWIATRPSVQWLGDRSYSLYLWHFPVIVLFLARVRSTPTLYDIIALVAISLVLAALSYRFVEQPTRRTPILKRSPARTLIIAAVAMGLTASLTIAYSFVGLGEAKSWDARAASVDTASPKFGAASADDGKLRTFIGDAPAITPNPLQAPRDRDSAITDPKCHADARAAVTPSCSFGPADAAITIALVGDSHARMYGTPFVKMAQENGWRFVTYFRSSCPFNPERRDREAANETICTIPNKAVMQELLDLHPDVVVTTWYGTAKFEDSSTGAVPGAKGFADYWNELEDAGSSVLVLRDVPTLADDLQACVSDNYDDPDVCGLPPAKALKGSSILDAALALSPRARLLDLTDRFCTATLCKPVIGSIMVYRDFHHITETYAESLRPLLNNELTAVLAARG